MMNQHSSIECQKHQTVFKHGITSYNKVTPCKDSKRKQHSESRDGGEEINKAVGMFLCDNTPNQCFYRLYTQGEHKAYYQWGYKPLYIRTEL